MNKTRPSFGRIAAMVGFTLSCFGLLLFLWLAFGGPIPLKPEGYRFQTTFSEATQLATEADVRISGVPVGTVKTITPDRETGRSKVEIELDSRYAPIASDAKAVLRQKTLLGETYVELTPGSPDAAPVPEDGVLAQSQVSDTTELDEIFRAFDPETRKAFQVWMQEQARALEGRGKDLNDALGTLGPLAEDASRVVDILNRQQAALQATVRDTGQVFDALSERRGQLRSLITNAEQVFRTTAAQDRRLQEAFVALPTFERESRQTVERLARFARDTDPLVTQLRPAAREISPTFTELAGLAPDLRALFRDLDPLISASRAGFPAAQRVLEDIRPLLGQIDPTGRQLVPILDFLGAYEREIAAFLGNVVASTQASELRPEGRLHYLRTTNPLNPENLASYPRRIGSNRTNPYVLPDGFDNLARKLHLESFETRHCNRDYPALSPQALGLVDAMGNVLKQVPAITDVIEQRFDIDPVVGVVGDPDFVQQIQNLAFGDPAPGGPIPAPPCDQQPRYDVAGEISQYPHLRELP
jgi:virulence factor Mce-like protein